MAVVRNKINSLINGFVNYANVGFRYIYTER